MKSLFPKLLLITMLVGLLGGCTLKYTIKDPVVSQVKYDKGTKKPIVMKVVDQRTTDVFHDKISNLKRANIELVNVDNPVAWLSQALEKEFAARDIPLKIADKDSKSSPDVVLTVSHYQIVSYRVSGFSPWESYHSFHGSVTADGRTCDVRAYFFNGKLPAWSMKEIEDPCFNMPMSVLVKEIASKINRCSLHYSASEEKIQEIQRRAEEKIKKEDDEAYIPVLELGSTNNPAALHALISFADAKERITRACALSAVGTLGAQDQIEFLKKKYKEYQSGEIDKFMALKSIGDIGTPEAIDFVKKAKEDPQYNAEYGFKYCVDLYLER